MSRPLLPAAIGRVAVEGIPDSKLGEVPERRRWNREKAAAQLGINRVTLWRRMKQFGIAA